MGDCFIHSGRERTEFINRHASVMCPVCLLMSSVSNVSSIFRLFPVHARRIAPEPLPHIQLAQIIHLSSLSWTVHAPYFAYIHK